jgi:uncharacterized protein YndB with AHSA1/START domain
MAMTIDRAQVSMPSDREVQVVRSFKAPRALVFRAFTEPPLIRRWMLGPPGWSMPVCDMDVRPGGKYRWRWRSDADGSEFGFFGTFREVQSPSRIIHIESFDPGSGGGGETPPDSTTGGALVTTAFSEDGGITTVTTVMDFGSKDARDAAVKTGMTDGMEGSYQLLDRILQEPGS